MKTFKNISHEEGYTLVEQLVALALFMAVLIPAMAFFIFMSEQMTVENKIIARSIAQREMELTLLNKTYTNQTKELAEKNWVVVKRIEKNGTIVEIYIKVLASQNAEEPLITLKTIRHAVEK